MWQMHKNVFRARLNERIEVQLRMSAGKSFQAATLINCCYFFNGGVYRLAIATMLRMLQIGRERKGK